MNAGWQHLHAGNATPPLVNQAEGTYAYGRYATMQNNITVGDDWKQLNSLDKGWLFWNQRDDPQFWSTTNFSGNKWYHTTRTNGFHISTTWNVWSDYAAFAAKTGETNGTYGNPGTLTCPANRPPTTTVFDEGW
jgi:hypothetical protein